MKKNKNKELSNDALESVAGGIGKFNWTKEDVKKLKQAAEKNNACIPDDVIRKLADIKPFDFVIEKAEFDRLCKFYLKS